MRSVFLKIGAVFISTTAILAEAAVEGDAMHYPPRSRALGIEGRVLVEVTTNDQGRALAVRYLAVEARVSGGDEKGDISGAFATELITSARYVAIASRYDIAGPLHPRHRVSVAFAMAPCKAVQHYDAEFAVTICSAKPPAQIHE